VPADLVRWQQLCAGWCVTTVSSICGQERQFPQNSATLINAAINELWTLRIATSFYPTFPLPWLTQRAAIPAAVGHLLGDRVRRGHLSLKQIVE